ncbi:sensor histidine kinase [Pseudobacteroides cellulosolvens]|uniref:histidine kinase n=1 Tax=Pseudobacteroides cellulosolvens ATCC 35603 = DSM 2933 TaxID=398512 RepID=A0A0L6JLX1_9FIRM|nr:HAMP domain-containing sensor histidine kinase [Pseudobacteroides cellulosolvens]KNY26402.1 integral membrane sensor signal transduction histidine kinase [Pseudobacteroides cellulosolvens ATCC 35603 = DSM 2933]
MGNLKNRKKYKATLLSIVMRAVYGIGFGIIALTTCVLIFLYFTAKKGIFSAKVYPNIELAIVIIYLCIVVCFIIFIPLMTVKRIRKRGQSILNVTEKIKEQDLDFNICLSGVKEIDQILESMDDMRIALKKALETQWRLEQNRKDQISALAHDFKTPITVLKGNIDLLQSSKLDDACKDYVEDAKISLKQIETYLSQLLEMTRAERGYVLDKQIIDLGEILDNVVSVITRIADEKEISIISEKEKENICLSADRTLLERVFNNLISNSLDFTSQKGVIKIILTTEESNAVISVTDSGCGFSPNAIKHGMEQFYMDDTSRGRKNHYGLGLYIVDSIIKQHDGTIHLANDEITGGAKVTIHIPLMKE